MNCKTTRRKTTLIILASLLLSLAAWGREDHLTNTGIAPGAEGTVTTDNDRNGNTNVEVKVKHMAGPQQLTPAMQTYIVWIQARGKEPEAIGVLRVNGDLEGALKGTTPYKDFDVLITAEDNLKPNAPSSMVMLKGTVERH